MNIDPFPGRHVTAARDLQAAGKLRPAGMGRGTGVWHSGQSRGDNILWLSDDEQGGVEIPEASGQILFACIFTCDAFYAILESASAQDDRYALAQNPPTRRWRSRVGRL